MLNVIFDPFLTIKTPFFTLFILSRASDNTISLNIGGPRQGSSPYLKFWRGTVPPVPPRSPPLLCALVTINTTYAVYFFLIHHCTNSLSSLHIFVHHCTFCA